MALRVVFMGTPDYGVPSLEALISAGYDVVGVFCQPDKPSGRGKRIAFCPVKQCALAHGIPVVQPVKTRVDGVEPLRALKPDLCGGAGYSAHGHGQCACFPVAQVSRQRAGQLGADPGRNGHGRNHHDDR